MNTQELLDEIEDEARLADIEQSWDRWTLLDWMSAELNRLTGELDCDLFVVHLNPAIYTVADQRYYDLPDNFGFNFLYGGGDSGDKWCCTYDDGSNETPLDFMPAVRFFSKNLTGESSGTPAYYTIIGLPNGGRQIGLSPKPDTASKEVNGLYKPTNWSLDEFAALPPLPGNCHILKYAVLMRLDATRWNEAYLQERNKLYAEIAKSRTPRFVPKLGRNLNDYSLIG